MNEGKDEVKNSCTKVAKAYQDKLPKVMKATKKKHYLQWKAIKVEMECNGSKKFQKWHQKRPRSFECAFVASFPGDTKRWHIDG